MYPVDGLVWPHASLVLLVETHRIRVFPAVGDVEGVGGRVERDVARVAQRGRRCRRAVARRATYGARSRDRRDVVAGSTLRIFTPLYSAM